MDSEAVTGEIIKVLSQDFEFDPPLTARTRFADAGLDSLVLLKLAVFLEKKYDAKFTEDELLDAGSVARVIELLQVRAN